MFIDTEGRDETIKHKPDRKGRYKMDTSLPV